MKSIAIYLPQFHQVEENDEWWGEGYTEWTAVKNAVPLFEGHKQPVEPVNNNYYNLLEKETMQQQAQLAKDYGIHGFCFYHYYFGNDKMILEKPAENLLKWKDIEMNFCFCWANQTWARTWSKARNITSWNERIDTNNQEKNEILLLQQYGREEEWKSHFEYLLPFFKDCRYIKKEGKPIFLIYRPELFPDLDAMLEYWNVLAKEVGLLGVYLIVINNDERKWEYVDASLMLEPSNTMRELRRKNGVQYDNGITMYQYKEVWNSIIARNNVKGRCIYQGGFVSFDDTPRRGNNGTLVLGSDIELFRHYLHQLKSKMDARGLDYLFINAWNEWGEGMHLEPDKQNEYASLEAVLEVVSTTGEEGDNKFVDYEIDEPYEEGNPLQRRYQLLNRWMFLREDGFKVEEYLLKYHWSNVAIYGCGYLGKHLVYELRNSVVNIAYLIDKNATTIIVDSEFSVKGLDEEFPIVDVVIVASFVEYREIKKMVRKKVDCPVISLEEIVMQLEVQE